MRPLLALALAAGLALGAVSALAERASADRTATTQILNQLQPDAGASASASASAPFARPLAEARNALARADNAAAAGDLSGARLLEGLAREWAELAVDVDRSDQAQRDAGAMQQAAADAGQRVQRARAMLEETAVRKSRAAGELKQLLEKADAATRVEPTPANKAPLPAGPPPRSAPKKGQKR